VQRSFEGSDSQASAFGPDGVDLVAQTSQLARIIPDRQIARLLNRCGVVTGHGNGWSEPRVRNRGKWGTGGAAGAIEIAAVRDLSAG
jgi:hypothetical protein